MWRKLFHPEMLVPILLILLSSVGNIDSTCCAQKERMSFYLESAISLLSKAKLENISCPDEKDIACGEALDCADLYRRGYNKSGVYSIRPISRITSMKSTDVYCDMTTDGGGWTVIQRRGNFGRADDYFNQNWESYRKGFGDLQRDFWLGNDNIFALTNQRQYSIRFDLVDNKNGTVFAHYDKFWIDDEFNKYTLHISDYRGTAGEAMMYHNDQKFSTKDRENDSWNAHCASLIKSGWWFNACIKDGSNLNGLYNGSGLYGIVWKNSLKNGTEIKIRPSNF